MVTQRSDSSLSNWFSHRPISYLSLPTFFTLILHYPITPKDNETEEALALTTELPFAPHLLSSLPKPSKHQPATHPILHKISLLLSYYLVLPVKLHPNILRLPTPLYVLSSLLLLLQCVLFGLYYEEILLKEVLLFCILVLYLLTFLLSCFKIF